MGESRTELLAWLNDLLQLGYTKVEQCGTGAAHCQIMDSVFRDVPLSKVKFNARHEYEYINNFKILQSVFDKHKIDNFIPVERLVKCRFQDNLEFMQWMKKYWDQYYPGGTYDALARRKGAANEPAQAQAHSMKTTKSAAYAPAAAPPKKVASAGIPKSQMPTRMLSQPAPSSHFAHSAAPAAGGGGMGGSAGWERERAELESEYQKIVHDMTQQTMELKVTIEQVEKEREFYFSKLREIEMFVQQHLDPAGAGNGHEPALNPQVEFMLKEVQGIMYKTEEGFEIPETEAGAADGDDEMY